MTQKIFKVPLTHDEMATVIEALKLCRQTIVSVGAIEFFTKEQKNLLQDIRVDVETLTDKIDRIFNGK